jgi:two-component system, NarL family, nitrate/nitrite response regulator NarL
MCSESASPNKTRSGSISVIIADDDSTVSGGIASVLGEQTDIDIIVACNTGKSAAAAIRQFAPDVAVLDIGIYDLNVLDVLSNIALGGFKTKVVCLTEAPAGHEITAALALGARGIIFKDTAQESIVNCVRDVFHGKHWFPAARPDIAPEHKVARRPRGKPLIRALTARQRQIALLVCSGLSNKQLGEQLNLTEGTVKVHLHKIYRKLGVRNRAALSALAMASRASLRA